MRQTVWLAAKIGMVVGLVCLVRRMHADQCKPVCQQFRTVEQCLGRFQGNLSASQQLKKCCFSCFQGYPILLLGHSGGRYTQELRSYYSHLLKLVHVTGGQLAQITLYPATQQEYDQFRAKFGSQPPTTERIDALHAHDQSSHYLTRRVSMVVGNKSLSLRATPKLAQNSYKIAFQVRWLGQLEGAPGAVQAAWLPLSGTYQIHAPSA